MGFASALSSLTCPIPIPQHASVSLLSLGFVAHGAFSCFSRAVLTFHFDFTRSPARVRMIVVTPGMPLELHVCPLW